MRKAKRITNRHKKEEFSKSEKELFELISEIIVEVVISGDKGQTERIHKKLPNTHSNPSI